MRFYLLAFLALDWIPNPEIPPVFWTLATITLQIDLAELLLATILLSIASIGFGYWLSQHSTPPLDTYQRGTPPEPPPSPLRNRKNGHLYDPILLDDEKEWELERNRHGR